VPTHPGEADAFRYRITRQTAAGAQTIELTGHAVPAALKDSRNETPRPSQDKRSRTAALISSATFRAPGGS
jgi:hypothetical protein